MYLCTYDLLAYCIALIVIQLQLIHNRIDKA